MNYRTILLAGLLLTRTSVFANSGIVSQDIGGVGNNLLQNFSNSQGVRTVAEAESLAKSQAEMDAVRAQVMGNQTAFTPTTLPTSDQPAAAEESLRATVKTSTEATQQSALQLHNLSDAQKAQIAAYQSDLETLYTSMVSAKSSANTSEGKGAFVEVANQYMKKVNTLAFIAESTGDAALRDVAGQALARFQNNIRPEVSADVLSSVNTQAKDEEFLQRLVQQEPKPEEPKPEEPKPTDPTAEQVEPPAPAGDPVQAACDRDFGARSASDLLAHLKSGPCAAAVQADPARAQLVKDVIAGLERYRKYFGVPGMKESLMMGGKLGQDIARLRGELGIRIAGRAGSVRDSINRVTGIAGAARPSIRDLRLGSGISTINP